MVVPVPSPVALLPPAPHPRGMDSSHRLSSRAHAHLAASATSSAASKEAASTRSAIRRVNEAAADDARRRLHEQGIVPIEPDEQIGVMLAPGEQLIAVRRSATLERRQVVRGESAGLAGDLYVTTRRLVHVGRITVAYPVEQVRDAIVAGERLLLVLGEGQGVAIDDCNPSLLRVQLGAARAAARAARRPHRPAEWGETRGLGEPGPGGSDGGQAPSR